MTGVALITGGGKRLGRAMALYLAGRGLDVAVHYNGSAQGAEDVVAQIEGMGRRAVALQADLLSEDATQALLPRAVQALGQVSCLVNNASVFEYDQIDTITRDSWDRHLDSNLRAPVVLTQALADQAPDAETDANGEPRARTLVVNMVDQRVRKLTPAFMSYTIAKMGLWAFTQTAAQALAPRVRVNAIGPGPTMQGARQSAAHFAAQRAAMLLGRGSDPGEICAALRFILAADGLTGQLLCMDGGQHLLWQTPDQFGVE